MENRNFTRVVYSECASVRHDGHVFFCDTKNVSLQGLYVKTDLKLPLDVAVEITVYHSPHSSIRFNANVVRCEEMGLGMRIKQIDLHSFVYLRDLVAMQCIDQDAIMRETKSMVVSIQ